MLTHGCSPDSITFGALITALERGGQWRHALQVRPHPEPRRAGSFNASADPAAGCSVPKPRNSIGSAQTASAVLSPSDPKRHWDVPQPALGVLGVEPGLSVFSSTEAAAASNRLDVDPQPALGVLGV